ncbi:MAG: ATP-binding protein [Halobacteriales archaeon]
MPQNSKTITITNDGITLPITSIVTGRGFITGKSGSGKSNTASVVIEELLKNRCPLLIIDTDGEYRGLKEQFKDLIHVGQKEESDVELTLERVDLITDLALIQGAPIILDVSTLKTDQAKSIINEVVTLLFHKEKEHRKHFLIVIEEIHEFIPQQGGVDELAQNIIRIAKRGRKRGLGICGISQRPSAVDKDFITQCSWSVWHRFTWAIDKKAVNQTLGIDYANQISSLKTGEAFLATDWDETSRISLKQKETFDEGATPHTSDIVRPTFKSDQSELIEQLRSIEGPPPELDPTALRTELTSKNSRIKDLENRILELTSELDANPPLPSTKRIEPPKPISPPNSSRNKLLEDSIESIKANAKKQTTTDVSQDFNPIWELGQLILYLWRVSLRGFLIILVKLIGIFKIKL